MSFDIHRNTDECGWSESSADICMNEFEIAGEKAEKQGRK